MINLEAIIHKNAEPRLVEITDRIFELLPNQLLLRINTSKDRTKWFLFCVSKIEGLLVSGRLVELNIPGNRIVIHRTCTLYLCAAGWEIANVIIPPSQRLCVPTLGFHAVENIFAVHTGFHDPDALADTLRKVQYLWRYAHRNSKIDHMPAHLEVTVRLAGQPLGSSAMLHMIPTRVDWYPLQQSLSVSGFAWSGYRREHISTQERTVEMGVFRNPTESNYLLASIPLLECPMIGYAESWHSYRMTGTRLDRITHTAATVDGQKQLWESLVSRWASYSEEDVLALQDLIRSSRFNCLQTSYPAADTQGRIFLSIEDLNADPNRTVTGFKRYTGTSNPIPPVVIRNKTDYLFSGDSEVKAVFSSIRARLEQQKIRQALSEVLSYHKEQS